MIKKIMKCEFCEQEYACEETRLGHWFCCYECLEGFYCDEIPEEEDFKSVPQ